MAEKKRTGIALQGKFPGGAGRLHADKPFGNFRKKMRV